MLQAQGEDPKRMIVMGSVVMKEHPADVRWADLFKGDEVGNVAILDLAKVQLFFFTLVLVLSYAIALAAKLYLAPKAGIAGFPPLDMGFVTVLGISNAGFLTNHAIPHPLPPDGASGTPSGSVTRAPAGRLIPRSLASKRRRPGRQSPRPPVNAARRDWFR